MIERAKSDLRNTEDRYPTFCCSGLVSGSDFLNYPVSLLEHLFFLPAKGRFLNQFHGRCIFSNPDWIHFLELLEWYPGRGIIFPLYQHFPALGGLPWIGLAIDVYFLIFIFTDSRFVFLVINILVHQDERVTFLIDFGV